MLLLTLSCKKQPSNKGRLQKHVYDFSIVEHQVNNWVQKGYYDGAGLMLVHNDSIILEQYFGNYKYETEVFIASAGKWLAAATISAVVEHTKLSWNDKVKNWLPEFTDAKGEATLKQLFSHTSGYPDYQPEGRSKDRYQTLEESVKHIVDLPINNAPGTIFHYGGLAMQVAGRMAELASNKDFETLFQEYIAIPLKMTNTHFIPVDDGEGHAPMLGGGAKSTLPDYMHFLDMIYNEGQYQGTRVLQANSIKIMQADHIENANISKEEYMKPVRGASHKGIYGLGQWREELDADGYATLISSPSWAGAYPWIDKLTHTYGFFITHVNVEQANADHFSGFYSSPILPMLVRKVLQNDN